MKAFFVMPNQYYALIYVLAVTAQKSEIKMIFAGNLQMSQGAGWGNNYCFVLPCSFVQ